MLNSIIVRNDQLNHAKIRKIGFDPVATLTIDLMSSFPMLHLTFFGTIGKSFAASTCLEDTFLASLFTTVGTRILESIKKQ